MPWLTQDIADGLLGNARPKTYEKCRQDAWWFAAFDRWWREGANGKPMYEAVQSLYEDLVSYYGGTLTEDSLYEEWVNDPPNVTLIDASARAEFGQAHRDSEDVSAAVGRLWDATAAQMEMVYQVFYEDVGVVKERLRREYVNDVIADAFPGL